MTTLDDVLERVAEGGQVRALDVWRLAEAYKPTRGKDIGLGGTIASGRFASIATQVAAALKKGDDGPLKQLSRRQMVDLAKKHDVQFRGKSDGRLREDLGRALVRPPAPTAEEARAAGYPDVPDGIDATDEQWSQMSYHQRLRVMADARPAKAAAPRARNTAAKSAPPASLDSDLAAERPVASAKRAPAKKATRAAHPDRREAGGGINPAKARERLVAARSGAEARAYLDELDMTQAEARQLAKDLGLGGGRRRNAVGSGGAGAMSVDQAKDAIVAHFALAWADDASPPRSPTTTPSAPVKAAKKAVKAAPNPEIEAERESRVTAAKTAVTHAYLQLARRPGDHVKLSDLRREMGSGHSRDDVDEALRQLSRERGTDVISTSGRSNDPNAVKIGGEVADTILMDGGPGSALTRLGASAPRRVVTDAEVSSATSTIADAFSRLPKNNGGWVKLADLRRELGPGADRGAVDEALKRMARLRGVDVIGELNQKTLTPEDMAASVVIGGQHNHLLSIGPDADLSSLLSPAEAPTPKPATAGRAARKVAATAPLSRGQHDALNIAERQGRVGIGLVGKVNGPALERKGYLRRDGDYYVVTDAGRQALVDQAPRASRAPELAREMRRMGGDEGSLRRALAEVKATELRDLAYELNLSIPPAARTAAARRLYMAQTLAADYRRTTGGL